MKRVKRTPDVPGTMSVSRIRAYEEAETGYGVVACLTEGDACKFILANKAGRNVQRLMEGVVIHKEDYRVTVITKAGGVAHPGPACVLAVSEPKDVRRITRDCQNSVKRWRARQTTRVQRTAKGSNGRVRRTRPAEMAEQGENV